LGFVVEVARRLGVKPEVLEKDAVKLWLRRRLKLVEAEIAAVLSRYNVGDPEELRARVEQGAVPEHPAWEDLVILENLVKEREKIVEVLGVTEG